MSEAVGKTPLVRDPWIDNAKAGLIILVVIGHMVSTPRAFFPTFEWIYDFINFFHMPAFLVISGFLMRGRVRKHQTDKIINKNLVPYITSQLLLYFIFALFVRGMEAATATNLNDGFSLFEPVYQMWFLLALVIYYFICVSLKPEKRPLVSMTVALVLSVCLGFFKTIIFMRLTKALCFFPFFLIGYLMTSEKMEKIKKSKFLPVLALGAFGLLGLFVMKMNGKYPYLIFLLSTRYDAYPEEYLGWYPVIARMIFLPLAMIVSLLYLSLVPRKRYFFTKYGERSIYIYVLHAIPVIIFRLANFDLEFYESMLQGAPAKAIYLLFSVMIAVVCASDPVVKRFKRILEPNFDINKFTDYFKNKEKTE